MKVFWRLLVFLRPYRSGVIWSFVLAGLAMVMTVAIPYLVGRTCRRHPRRPREPLAARRGDPGGRRAPLRAERIPPARGRARVARGRVRPAQPHVRAPAVARARLLRRAADGAAHVARDRRPPGRPLLPRLRADLHRAVGAHDPDRGRGDARRQPRPRRDHPRAHAVRRVARVRLRHQEPARPRRRCSSGSRSSPPRPRRTCRACGWSRHSPRRSASSRASACP